MKPSFRLAALAILPLALAACGEKEQATQTSAGGEILPGSASDAMLPLDTVRSQPPLAPMTQATGGPRGAGTASGEPEGEASDAAAEASGGASEASAAPAPAATGAATPAE